MPPHAIPPRNRVLPTSEARARLSQITAQFRRRGAAAGLVVHGDRRKPEAAVVPYELIELLDPFIEDLVIAAQVRERLAADDGTRYSLAEVAAELGVDLDKRDWVKRRVELLAAARKDLEWLLEDDSRLVDRAVRLLSQLETGEVDGEPLRQMAATGDLSDCRKLYFGLGAPGSHQIVYREVGEETVEVLEVIAVEAREELYAYLLTAQRLGSSDR